MTNLKGKTIFITGASRGIGRAIALKFAQQGANVAIIAKTAEPHATLAGTIFTVADEVNALGGHALPLQCDVRDETQIAAAVNKTVQQFGGIDFLVNNASAIFLAPTNDTPMKRFDLMLGCNVRATFACAQACLPFLEKASNPAILTLSPPLNMDPKWFKDHVAYTISKYGMSMCTLGMAEEFKARHIRVNSLWPRTTIATAAVEVNFPAAIYKASRKPEIMADAAYNILIERKDSGQFFLDEDVLRDAGVKDFDQYALTPGLPLFTDLYVEAKK